MKTRLISSYKLANQNERLSQLIAINLSTAFGLVKDVDTRAYFIYEFKDNHIEKKLINPEIQALDIYKVPLDSLVFGVVLFSTPNGFGILIREYIYFYNSLKELEKVVLIMNDPPADKHNRYYSPNHLE